VCIELLRTRAARIPVATLAVIVAGLAARVFAAQLPLAGWMLTAGVQRLGHDPADVVILSDEPARVVEAIEIGQRPLGIARESIWVGLGPSGVAMLFAAGGNIPTTVGALLREGIDLAVISNLVGTSR
jgi:hypothetical protein